MRPRVAPKLVLALLALVACGWLSLGESRAHGLDPVGITVTERADGTVSVHTRVPPKVPHDRVRVELPLHCQAAGQDASSYHCDAPLAGHTLRVVGLEGYGNTSPLDALVKLDLADGRSHRAAVDARQPLLTVPSRATRIATALTYLRLGAHHFVTGWDHLLFALGVLALAQRLRPAALLLTSFAVGHSLTLSAAVLGYLSFPRAWAELLIALTLVGLALRVGRQQDGAQPVRDSPWTGAAATLVVGLVHGLGFASALRGAGLPDVDVPAALLAFNLGIEVAQVGTLLLAALAVHAARRWRPRWSAPSRLVIAHAMGALAVMWCCERALALVGVA